MLFYRHSATKNNVKLLPFFSYAIVQHAPSQSSNEALFCSGHCLSQSNTEALQVNSKSNKHQQNWHVSTAKHETILLCFCIPFLKVSIMIDMIILILRKFSESPVKVCCKMFSYIFFRNEGNGAHCMSALHGRYITTNN